MGGRREEESPGGLPLARGVSRCARIWSQILTSSNSETGFRNFALSYGLSIRIGFETLRGRTEIVCYGKGLDQE